MNGGTNRGQADGFQLSVLNKIKDVKTQVSKDRENRCKINVTYMHFALLKPTTFSLTGKDSYIKERVHLQFLFRGYYKTERFWQPRSQGFFPRQRERPWECGCDFGTSQDDQSQTSTVEKSFQTTPMKQDLRTSHEFFSKFLKNAFVVFYIIVPPLVSTFLTEVVTSMSSKKMSPIRLFQLVSR